MRQSRYDRHLGCFVEMCSEIICGKWKGRSSTTRWKERSLFGELRRPRPQVTRRMLTMQLRELEEHGVIVRNVYAEMPPTVEYSIFADGCKPRTHHHDDEVME